MILQILEYGDPILRSKGKPIENIDDRIRQLAANMIETRHLANGVAWQRSRSVKLCSSQCSMFPQSKIGRAL